MLKFPIIFSPTSNNTNNLWHSDYSGRSFYLESDLYPTEFLISEGGGSGSKLDYETPRVCFDARRLMQATSGATGLVRLKFETLRRIFGVGQEFALSVQGAMVHSDGTHRRQLDISSNRTLASILVL